MEFTANSRFTTNYDWFNFVVGDSELILCYTSALECLGLFMGYFNNDRIEVYAREHGTNNSIVYRILPDFNDIDVVRRGSLLCTSPSQTFNDIFSKYGTPDEATIDEQSLIEGLSKYYFTNGESFDGLNITQENAMHFERLKTWAVEYYDED